MTRPGTPSDPGLDPEPAAAMGRFDPFSDRQALRLTTLYATSSSLPVTDLERTGRPAGEVLRLGRLGPFFETSQLQLPWVVRLDELDPGTLEFDRWRYGVQNARAWLFAVPSGHLLLGLSLDVSVGLVASIPLLEDLYYAAVNVDREPLATWAAALVPGGVGAIERMRLHPDRHQLVFQGIADGAPLPDADELQRAIYRADLPARDVQSAIVYPGELNRRPTTVGALGPYVSVVAGQQDYIENAVLLSAVQVVGAASRLREIRHSAHESVAAFRANTNPTLPVRQRRLTLERVSDTLGALELDLSFSVEAVADLGLLVPALRVEAYHEALYGSMNLTRRAATTGDMLTRLRNAVDAELTAVQSVEARVSEDRRIRTTAAVTLLTTVAGTLGLLFAYFGINASQIDGSRSMFDRRYLAIYLAVLVIVAVSGAVYLVLGTLARQRNRLEQEASAAGSAAGVGDAAVRDRESGPRQPCGADTAASDSVVIALPADELLRHSAPPASTP